MELFIFTVYRNIVALRCTASLSHKMWHILFAKQNNSTSRINVTRVYTSLRELQTECGGYSTTLLKHRDNLRQLKQFLSYCKQLEITYFNTLPSSWHTYSRPLLVETLLIIFVITVSFCHPTLAFAPQCINELFVNKPKLLKRCVQGFSIWWGISRLVVNTDHMICLSVLRHFTLFNERSYCKRYLDRLTCACPSIARWDNVSR